MAMRTNGPDGNEMHAADKAIHLSAAEEISPALADAMRGQLAAFRMSRRWSYYVLCCDITDQTGVALGEEALRRWLLGTQQLKQHKLRAILAFLEDHNPETAARARLTRRAIAAADGLGETTCDAALPSMQEIAGLFAAEYLESDRITLEFVPVARNAALIIERLYAGGDIAIATGFATLDAQGTLKLRIDSPRGYSYYYDHHGTVRPDANGPIQTLVMGRTGMPLDLSGRASEDRSEIFNHIAENLLWFHRVPDSEAGAAAGLPPARRAHEERARERAPVL